MLGYIGTLKFPRLIHLREGSLIRLDANGASGRNIDIYRLDWASHVQRMNLDRPIFPSDDFHVYIDSRQYAIDGNYMREINRNAREASLEWSMKRSFDTNIREQCLEPAIAHAWVAFMLLADCAYDANTQWYERGAKSNLLSHMLAWSFWQGQTGIGCVDVHAKIDCVRRRIVPIGHNQDMITEGSKLIEACDAYIEKWRQPMIDEGGLST